ncbi:TorF family putative porin [Pseudomonas aegrilactucae]|uniref:TorF family putative porin n=1 Tax=Pseudomonas aegrilactucae TaxID=2854028 RepID=A0A9Q3AEI4_9PSED|nr:TorF family putative porin [Pseudomonas aegrilactucae]MBV6288544.1 TorF family putative porin [Pseudomonas aegrilactucae]
MPKYAWLLVAVVGWQLPVHAQLLKRELGDFDLSLGSTPSRSMAQGLVKPATSGTFHGGLDLAHDSGWYLGQWAPSMGLSNAGNLQVDSYVGYKQPYQHTLGYEVGVIHYSYPNLSDADSQALYAGLNLQGHRFGVALGTDRNRRTSTLFSELGQFRPLDLGVSLKLTHYALNTPFTLGEHDSVQAFSDWSLTFSRPWLGIDLDLIYSDSSLTDSGCQAWAGQDPHCSGMLTFKAERALF